MMLVCSSVPFLVTISFIVGISHTSFAADDKRNFLAHTDDRNTTVPLGEHMETAEEASVKEETANNAAEQCMAGTMNIYYDAIYAACYDTAGAGVDDGGDGCYFYIDNPGLCGLKKCVAYAAAEEERRY